MQILITPSFSKEFLSVLRHERFLMDFVKMMRLKHHTLIDIHIPYHKFRFSVGGIVLRGIIYRANDGTCIPLLVAKKSDKKYGHNMMWDTALEKTLLARMNTAIEEIQSREHQIF